MPAPDIFHHQRRSIRLKGFDYSQAGAYFVTICTLDRKPLFGEIVNDEMRLNEFGEVAQDIWLEIPAHFPDIELDEFVVMPNHIHGIIVITDSVGAQHAAPFPTFEPIMAQRAEPSPSSEPEPVGVWHAEPSPSSEPEMAREGEPSPTSEPARAQHAAPLPTIIRSYKSAVTKRINEKRSTPGAVVWQRNYYEHVIRNEDDLDRIRAYIAGNPAQWQSDTENPARTTHTGNQT